MKNEKERQIYLNPFESLRPLESEKNFSQFANFVNFKNFNISKKSSSKELNTINKQKFSEAYSLNSENKSNSANKSYNYLDLDLKNKGNISNSSKLKERNIQEIYQLLEDGYNKKTKNTQNNDEANLRNKLKEIKQAEINNQMFKLDKYNISELIVKPQNSTNCENLINYNSWNPWNCNNNRNLNNFNNLLTLQTKIKNYNESLCTTSRDLLNNRNIKTQKEIYESLNKTQIPLVSFNFLNSSNSSIFIGKRNSKYKAKKIRKNKKSQIYQKKKEKKLFNILITYNKDIQTKSKIEAQKIFDNLKNNRQFSIFSNKRNKFQKCAFLQTFNSKMSENNLFQLSSNGHPILGIKMPNMKTDYEIQKNPNQSVLTENKKLKVNNSSSNFINVTKTKLPLSTMISSSRSSLLTPKIKPTLLGISQIEKTDNKKGTRNEYSQLKLPKKYETISNFKIHHFPNSLKIETKFPPPNKISMFSKIQFSNNKAFESNIISGNQMQLNIKPLFGRNTQMLSKYKTNQTNILTALGGNSEQKQSLKYRISYGNNSNLIKAVFSQRYSNWEYSNKDKNNLNFRWEIWGKHINFKTISNNNYQQLFNHFEFYDQLTTKDKLFLNMSEYCESSRINVFDYVPLTFSFNSSSKEEYTHEIEIFYKLFNLIKTYLNSSVSSEFQIQNLNHEIIKLFPNKARQSCKPKLEETWISNEKLNLWIIKPTEFNRGEGVSVFNDLCYLKKYIADFLNKDENKNTSTMKILSNVNPIGNREISEARGEVILNGNNKDETGRDYQFPSKYSKLEQLGPSNVKSKKFIIQKYIEQPLLFYGRKFDIRVWVLINQEMKVFLFKEGYLRTSTKKFKLDLENIGNKGIHLTNNAIQKNLEGYGCFEDGNQISFSDFQIYLDKIHSNINFKDQIYPQIKKFVSLSTRSIKQRINIKKRVDTFEIFGYDFIVDREYRVWLIEVNTTPCLEESSNLLRILLPRMINDAFRLTVDIAFPGSFEESKQIKYIGPGYNNDDNLFEYICDLNARANSKIKFKNQSDRKIIFSNIK